MQFAFQSLFVVEDAYPSLSSASRRSPRHPSMPHLPKNLAPIRHAVVSLLRPRHHYNNLYAAADIAEALNVAADVTGNPAIDRGVDASLLLRAFAFDGADEVFLSLKDVFGYLRNPHGLYIRKPVRSARDDNGVLAIGRFASKEEASNAPIVRWEVILEDDAREGLVSYLEEASKPKTSKRKRPAGVSPCSGSSERPPLATVLARNIPSCPNGTKLNYLLGGRAGSVNVPSNGLILLRKLSENFLPSPVNDENAWSNKSYNHQSYGSAQYWTQAGVVGITKTELTQLREQA